MARIIGEAAGDTPAVEALLDLCFGPERHARTSQRLRDGRLPADGLALKAEDGAGRLLGTIRLWNIEAGHGRPALLLGPLAVHPASRGQGLGAALIRTGLARAALGGHGAVLLVGDPEYYGRFGFTGAHTGGLLLPGPVEARRFLGLELVPGALEAASGPVRATGRPAPVRPVRACGAEARIAA